GRRRPRLRLEIGDQVDDLVGREGAARPPRRHRRLLKQHARVVDLHVQVGVAEPATADRRQVGADAAGRPHVLTRHEMTASARALLPREEQRAAFLRIAGDASGRRHALHRRRRPPVAVRVGTKRAEVLLRPPRITDGFALAVVERAHVTACFGNGPRRPRWSPRVAGGVGCDGGTAREDEKREGADQPNLMSAVPSYLPPRVSRKVTLSCPGSVARNANEKNGFSLTDWVVSNAATCLPRYVTRTLLM